MRPQTNAPDIVLDVVCTQRDALARLARLEGAPYDLALLDMRLSDGDGLAVLAHILARDLPLAVVIVTGTGDSAPGRAACASIRGTSSR